MGQSINTGSVEVSSVIDQDVFQVPSNVGSSSKGNIYNKNVTFAGTAETLIYTVPAGKRFMVYGVVVKNNEITTITFSINKPTGTEVFYGSVSKDGTFVLNGGGFPFLYAEENSSIYISHAGGGEVMIWGLLIINE